MCVCAADAAAVNAGGPSAERRQQVSEANALGLFHAQAEEASSAFSPSALGQRRWGDGEHSVTFPHDVVQVSAFCCCDREQR